MLCIYLFGVLCFFWLCWLFVATHKLSVVAASGDCSLGCGAGFSLQGLLLLQSTGSTVGGLSSCGTGPWLLHSMWNPPCTRDQTRVPCVGRQILNHWTTREAPVYLFFGLVSKECANVNKYFIKSVLTGSSILFCSELISHYFLKLKWLVSPSLLLTLPIIEIKNSAVFVCVIYFLLKYSWFTMWC